MSNKTIAKLILALLFFAILTCVYWQTIWFVLQKPRLETIVSMVIDTDAPAASYRITDNKLSEEELGKIRVISRNPDAIQIDYTGGHRVFGFLYCETKPEDFKNNFGESIVFKARAANWWEYRSSEE